MVIPTLCSSSLVVFIWECMSAQPLQILKNVNACLPILPSPTTPKLNQKLGGHSLLPDLSVTWACASIMEPLLPIPGTSGL